MSAPKPEALPGRPRKPDAPHQIQLRSGRHGLAPEEVRDNQRQRIVRAMVETVVALGYPAAVVERVASRAGVSRRTFYELFENREHCYLYTYDQAATLAFEQVARATRDEELEWPDQLRAGLGTFLTGIAAQPDLAHVCLVDVLAAGPAALEHRATHTRAFAGLLEETAVAQTGRPLAPLAAEGLVAAIADVLYRRVAEGRSEAVPELLDDLCSFCLMLFQQPSREHS